MKIELGKYYADGEGNVYGPMLSDNDYLYPFTEPDFGWRWSAEGKFQYGGCNNADLIEEVLP